MGKLYLGRMQSFEVQRLDYIAVRIMAFSMSMPYSLEPVNMLTYRDKGIFQFSLRLRTLVIGRLFLAMKVGMI